MPYQTREFYETQGKLFLEGKLQLDSSNDEIRGMVLNMFDNLKVGSVLNVGIGPKPLIDIELFKRDYSIVGIDISYSCLAAAKMMLNCKGIEPKLILSEAINLPFPAGAFDLCLCSEVIEHLENPGALLREISRILKPDGKLILTTPNKFSLSKGIINLRQMLCQREPTIDNSVYAKEYTYYGILRICQKFFNLQAYYHTKAFPTKGLSFFRAPIGRMCNFITELHWFNKLLPSTFGFILAKLH